MYSSVQMTLNVQNLGDMTIISDNKFPLIINIHNQGGTVTINHIHTTISPPFRSSYRDIFAAARRGTVQDVRYFVEKGVNVNSVADTSRWTPLHFASKYNPNADVLTYLLSQGANVNARASNGFTPLNLANFGAKVDILWINGGRRSNEL